MQNAFLFGLNMLHMMYAVASRNSNITVAPPVANACATPRCGMQPMIVDLHMSCSLLWRLSCFDWLCGRQQHLVVHIVFTS